MLLCMVRDLPKYRIISFLSSSSCGLIGGLGRRLNENGGGGSAGAPALGAIKGKVTGALETKKNEMKYMKSMRTTLVVL